MLKSHITVCGLGEKQEGLHVPSPPNAVPNRPRPPPRLQVYLIWQPRSWDHPEAIVVPAAGGEGHQCKEGLDLLHGPPAGTFAGMESPRCWQILPALFDALEAAVGPRAVQGVLREESAWVRRECGCIWRRAMADPASGDREGHWGGSWKEGLCREDGAKGTFPTWTPMGLLAPFKAPSRPGWVTTLKGGAVRSHLVNLKEFQGLGGLIILWCRRRKGQALLEKEPCAT